MDLMSLILIFGGGAVVILLVIGIIITARSERTLVEERLGRYLEDEVEIAAQRAEERPSPLGEWLNRRMEGSKMADGIAKELARADLKLKPAEYIAAMLIFGILGALIGGVFFGAGGKPSLDMIRNWQVILFGIIGFIVGMFMPRVYVRREQGKRLVRFGEQLADMLNLMVNGLRAGYSTMQAMEAVSREMPMPICDEFRRVVQEMQLGIAMEQALDNLLRRIPSGDLDLVITAMNVQREVGGNLAEILDTISFTIRERVRIKGEIRVLTSQVMYSGRFLAMMPLFIAGVLWLLNKPYMMQFFSEPKIVGIIALVVAALMIISGYFIMMKIANIDV
ncbi:MAG: type II secretion system F family protein [Anaerolineales bacterium]|nr:type II secretion system F family protein [Anaerolineales bacterium]